MLTIQAHEIHLPVLRARKLIMSPCKSMVNMVNAQAGHLIFLLIREIRLHLSKANFSATVSTQICLRLSSAMNLGPGNTPLLIFMHDVIIHTQNEAIGTRPKKLAVAAPMALFWVRIVTYSCINIKGGV